jgi:hypothetical protein
MVLYIYILSLTNEKWECRQLWRLQCIRQWSVSVIYLHYACHSDTLGARSAPTLGSTT